MFNPKSLENLRHFKPGDKPHHVKQPGEVSLTAALKRYYKAHPEELDNLAESIARQAHENPAYAKEVFDRLDGKVLQATDNIVRGELIVRWDGNRNTTEKL